MNSTKSQSPKSVLREGEICQRSTKMPDIIVGQLPVEKLNRALGLELEAGVLVLTGNAQVHAARRHPAEYSNTLPHLTAALDNAAYAGDDLKNPDSIEIIGRVQSQGTWILIAVRVALANQGQYQIASFYRISDEKIQKRKAKGYLKILPLT